MRGDERPASVRQRFDHDWRFHKGDVRGGQRPALDDRAWRALDLPHDWSIEGPFDERDPGGKSGGYLPGGVGWYRKRFALPPGDGNRAVWVDFDGVYMNATVWLNGGRVGGHAYGYTPFRCELTGRVRGDGGENILAVRVDNSLRPNTRWYSGAGIYRHVWLSVGDRLRLARYGIGVTTPRVTAARATVVVATRVENGRATKAVAILTTRITDPNGSTVASGSDRLSLEAGASTNVERNFPVPRPRRWDLDDRALYTVHSELRVEGRTVDAASTPFGIRTIAVDARRGFVLNGRRLKLKGVNLHHDHGCLGAASHDRAEERKVELMRSIGANAIRCSHNPPAPAFLDACDRLGMLVIDEAFDEWEKGKLAHGYKDYFARDWRDDLAAMVLRDRNHPSVVMWSIGNEVPEQRKPSGARTAARLAAHVRRLDPSRPVTYGAHPGGWTEKLWEALDVAGYNYREDRYAADHAVFPKRCIVGTETFPLDAFNTWTRALSHDHVLGEFIWTGMDYIGESGIGHARAAHAAWPANLACCGELDLCGFKKTRSYYRDILWNNGTELHIAVRRPLADGEAFKLCRWGWPDAEASWTWPAKRRDWPANVPPEMQVDVYSACEAVELRLNGRVVGRNTTGRSSRYLATWLVPYKPGTLEAVGYRGGKPVARQVLRTAGPPAALRLIPDRKTIRGDGADLAFVTAEILDETGMRRPDADHEIAFAVRGPAEIIGVANGDPASLESFQGTRRRAYCGRCLAVVRSRRGARPGRIVLVARAPGLRAGRTTIVSRA